MQTPHRAGGSFLLALSGLLLRNLNHVTIMGINIVNNRVPPNIVTSLKFLKSLYSPQFPFHFHFLFHLILHYRGIISLNPKP